MHCYVLLNYVFLKLEHISRIYVRYYAIFLTA